MAAPPSPDRPVILLTLGHYLPGFRAGGGVRSIAHLVDNLADAFDFRILTSDRDLGDAKAYPGIEVDRWVPVGPALVRYISPGHRMPVQVVHLIRAVPHDLLYLNSFFAPRLSILPLTLRRLGLIPRRPTVLAPRGEFSPGAMALKAAKKQSYLTVARATGLFDDLCWHASTAFEADDIRAVIGPGAKVSVARDLMAGQDEVPPAHVPRAPGEPLRIVFVSRLSPKKNLAYALRVLQQVRAPVRFTICGPDEDAGYTRLCRRLAGDLPSHIHVEWTGPLPPARIGACFSAHDLFFFPTRGENFGHVVAESLAAGTPVLVSDTTPWRGLAAAGVGDDLGLGEPAAFAARIEAMAHEPPQDAAARRLRAAAYVRNKQQDEGDVLANRLVFQQALGR